MVDGVRFQINGVITCNTTGCVYRITCRKCKEFVYYGETGRALKKQFWEHKNDILNFRAKAVPEHFNLPGHALDDLIFVGIERVLPTHDAFLRKQRESFYICKARAVEEGANRRR